MKFVVAGFLGIAGTAAIARAVREDLATLESGGFPREIGLFVIGVVLIVVGICVAIFGD